MRQDKGPPHTTVLPRELKGQVEPQLDEYVAARQTREAPVHILLMYNSRCAYKSGVRRAVLISSAQASTPVSKRVS